MTHAPDTVRRILDGSTELFVKHGYHGLAMREIAAAVGVSKPALYYHFRDKESLFVAVLEHHLAQVTALVALARRAPSAYEGLAGFLESFFGLPVASRQLIRASAQEVRHLSPAAQGIFLARYEADFLRGLEELLGRGVAAGELRPSAESGLGPELALRALLGLLFPFVAVPTEAGAGKARALLQLYWRGLGAPD